MSSDSGQVCNPSNHCGAGIQGCLSVNATIGIDEYNLDNNVTIYPNPTKDKLYFKDLEIREKTHITIENTLGEKVVDSELKNPEINISNFYHRSLYIVKIQNKTGLSLLKFLKE